jgi:hypothetical protein
MVWYDCIWLRIRTSGNVGSGSTNAGFFPNALRTISFWKGTVSFLSASFLCKVSEHVCRDYYISTMEKISVRKEICIYSIIQLVITVHYSKKKKDKVFPLQA